MTIIIRRKIYILVLKKIRVSIYINVGGVKFRYTKDSSTCTQKCRRCDILFKRLFNSKSTNSFFRQILFIYNYTFFIATTTGPLLIGLSP